MFLRTEGRVFKEKSKLFMPPRSLDESSLFSLKFKFLSNWYHKNGSVRKLDIQNLEKILIDAISEKYIFDDKRVWHKEAEKTQSSEDKIMVTISKLIGDPHGDKVRDGA